jgi:hypothetical protein
MVRPARIAAVGGVVVADLGCVSSPGALAWLACALAVALGLGIRRRR